MASLSKLKAIDQTSKDAVFGYIKQFEKSLILNNIPMAVYYLCLAYYYFAEYFDKFREDCFKLSDDKWTIKCIKQCHADFHTIYMKKWFHSQTNKIIKWTLKMNKLSFMHIGFRISNFFTVYSPSSTVYPFMTLSASMA